MITNTCLIGGSFVAAAGVDEDPDEPDGEPPSDSDPEVELAGELELLLLELLVALFAELVDSDAAPLASGVDSDSAGGGSDCVEAPPGWDEEALGLAAGSTSLRCEEARGEDPCGSLAAAAPSSTPKPRNAATSAAEKRAGSGSEPLRPSPAPVPAAGACVGPGGPAGGHDSRARSIRTSTRSSRSPARAPQARQ
jgi:hypothetical protein